MKSYANNTLVSVERSKAELEHLVCKYGAHAVVSGYDKNHAYFGFEMKDRRVQFVLTMPDKSLDEFRFTPSRKWSRTPDEAYKAWEQACRQKWRALVLVVKAKLEAVESKITTFEHEFLAHFVLPNGCTVADIVIPRLDSVIRTGKLPPMLPSPADDVIEVA